MSPSTERSASSEIPTFLVIGADPYDLEWLRRNLSAHPHVHVPESEVAYFSNQKRLRALGQDWYAAQFDPAAGEHVVGEITMQYMLRRNDPAAIARKIKARLPRVRLVAALRNPLDGLFLEWHARALAGHVEQGGLLKRLREVDPEQDPLALISNRMYGAALRRYVSLFGDQLLVVIHDEIRLGPAAVFERVLRHIGAEPGFVPPDLEVVDSPEVQRPELTEEELDELRRYFRFDVALLERLLDRDLDDWREFATSRVVRLWTGEWLLPRNWQKASTWIESLVANTPSDQFHRATPCAGWNVGNLLDHMVALLRDAVDVLRDEPTLWQSDVASEAASAYREAAAAFANAIAESAALPETVTAGGDEMPAHFFAYTVFVNLVVHGWDLAVATNQETDVPADVLAPAERVGRPFLDGIPRRGETIDVEVSPPEDANATERFIAFVGRDASAWRRGRRASTSAR